IASPYGAGHDNAFTHPISSRHKMMETLTIFDDVFVPNQRVFMNGEWQFAGALAKTFVEFHRFTAISYKLPLLDLLVGSALLIAEQNGIERAGHVREKLTWLISYAETVSGEQRLRTINLISDLTTGEFGGYQAVLAIHAEGSLEAEKLTILREYDQEHVKKYARRIIGYST